MHPDDLMLARDDASHRKCQSAVIATTARCLSDTRGFIGGGVYALNGNA